MTEVNSTGNQAYGDNEHPDDFNKVIFSDELLKQKLFEFFQLRNFRTNQLEVIKSCLQGRDCLVLMPTGGGKTLCYQLPGMMAQGVTLVISPLKSLMFDQVNKLLNLHIPAIDLCNNNNPNADLIRDQLENADGSNLKFVYCTPEKLINNKMLQSFLKKEYSKNLLQRIVIDEAHCISQWGYDFRPEYHKLNFLKEEYPTVPFMALTATASQNVRDDILNRLKIKNPNRFISSFNRPNLKYIVHKTNTQSMSTITTLIKENFHGKHGIVYCLTKQNCEEMSKRLNALDISSRFYHGGMEDDARSEAQLNWIQRNVLVICATSAFGMGIDKPDVRFVIHQSMSWSLENYFQESGRAGRDGKPSHCVLYYSPSDLKTMNKIIHKESDTNNSNKKMRIDALKRIFAFCENNQNCRRMQLLQYFDEPHKDMTCNTRSSSPCDFCETKLKRSSIDKPLSTKVSDESRRTSRYEADDFQNGGARPVLRCNNKSSTTRKETSNSQVSIVDWSNKLVDFCNELIIPLGIRMESINFSKLEFIPSPHDGLKNMTTQEFYDFSLKSLNKLILWRKCNALLNSSSQLTLRTTLNETILNPSNELETFQGRREEGGNNYRENRKKPRRMVLVEIDDPLFPLK